jgi:hypothetical protein
MEFLKQGKNRYLVIRQGTTIGEAVKKKQLWIFTNSDNGKVETDTKRRRAIYKTIEG